MSDLGAPKSGDAVDHVAIGREVPVVDGDDPAARHEIQRDVDLLEDGDRGRLVNGHLAGPCAEQWGQFVADREREIEPVVLPP